MLATIFALAVMVVDVWAIVSVFRSPAVFGTKIAWTVLILLLPLLGMLLWLVMGPRPGKL